MEDSKATHYSKLGFLIGAILLFISIFLEWYTFQVFDETSTLIGAWTYTIFFEWDTPFSSGNPTNEGYRPVNLNIPLVIIIMFIIILIAAVFVVLFKYINSTPLTLRKYSYVPLFLVILTSFYVVIFPLMYLLPNELYFPSLTNIDSEVGYSFSYSISFGYILQLCGFVLIFPYAVYYNLIITERDKLYNRPHVQIDNIIHQVQEKIDLDKEIAEEVEHLRRM